MLQILEETYTGDLICTRWECYPEEAALGLRTRGEDEWTRERRMERISTCKGPVVDWEASTGTQKRTSMATTQIVELCRIGVE